MALNPVGFSRKLLNKGANFLAIQLQACHIVMVERAAGGRSVEPVFKHLRTCYAMGCLLGGDGRDQC